MVLGLVTIGQSPRDDIIPSMFGDAIPSGLIQAGALDHLDQRAIDALAPDGEEYPLVTRLRDSSEVVVAKHRLMPLMVDAVSRLEAAGCEIICVLCTGEFPRLGTSSIVVYPDRVVLNVVDALLPEGTLGVLMPHPGQQASAVEKWSTASRKAITGAASPYSSPQHIGDEVRRLVAGGADAIVLDCMGFDRRMLADARGASSVPVLLSNGVVGSVLRELAGVSAGFLQHAERA